MFDYRWLKILESLYDNGHQLRREELVQSMEEKGVQVDDENLDRDLFVLQDEGFIKRGIANGLLILTDLGVKKIQGVRRGY